MPNSTMVKLDELHDMPVPVKSISKIYTKIIEDAKDAGAILVGKVDGKLYPVNEFEVVTGMKNAGIKKINAIIIDYLTIDDLIVSHVRQNFKPQTINPLKIYNVIDHFVDKGMSISEACEKLWLDKRSEYMEIQSPRICDKARAVFDDMIDIISDLVYLPVIPFYFIRKTAKIDTEHQEKAAEMLKTYSTFKILPTSKHSWVSADGTDTILHQYPHTAEITPTKSRIGQYVELKDIVKPEKKITKHHTPNKRTIQNAKKFIENEPNLIYVPTKGAQPNLIMNKKTGRVADVKENNKTLSVLGDRGEHCHIIPNDVSHYLDLGNDSVFIYKFSSYDQIIKILSKAKDKQIKSVLITMTKLKK